MPDGTYQAVFGHNLHYEAEPGRWEDVDLSFRPLGQEEVADRNAVVVRVTDRGISVADRQSGEGIRWLTPGRPEVEGRLARFSDQGLDWQYEATPTGIKLTATVAAKRGPRTYEFRYQLVGESPSDLILNDRGELVGKRFIVPPPAVAGADGRSYPTGRWNLLPGQRLAFDFDDGPLPPAAFPYVLDPTTTFGSWVEDGWGVTGYSATYPPTDGMAAGHPFSAGNDYLPSGGSNGRVSCVSACYATTTGLVRWNTASLPDDAMAFFATVGGNIGPVDKADDLEVMYSWARWWPVGWEDYNPDPSSDPNDGMFLRHIKPNAYNEFGFANDDTSGVSTTGYTEMRYLVGNGSAPTGSNGFGYTSFPTLKLNYCAGSTASTRYGGEVAADNPISYWPLDESAPGGACDIRGRNHGRTYGGVAVGQSAAVSGTAMGFDGSSGYVSLNGATSLQPTAALSVEGWIKTTAMGFQTVLRSRWSGYDLYLQDGLPTGFACGSANPCAESIGGSFAYKVQGTQSVADGGWHHLVLTKDAGMLRLYVDGREVASRAHTEALLYSGSGIAIGRDGDAAYAYANGTIDEVAVYGHALSAQRVGAHFAAGPVVTAGTTAADGNPSVNLCQKHVGQPVSTSNGNFWHTFADISIPRRGPGLDLARTYNSSAAGTDSPFGWGWSSTYTMRADTDVAGIVTVTQENGSQVTFTPAAAGAYSAPSWVLATLARNADGTFTFTRRARETLTFSAAGALTALKDLNGYVTAVALNASGRPTTVTDPAGRAFSFTYGANGKVARVADATGRGVSYGYDGAGNLVSVTDVTDGLTTFTYDPAHRVLTMTLPRRTGAYTNHYDGAGRVDSQTDPLGRVTTLDYTSVPGSTKVTSPGARTVTLDTYRSGQLVSQTLGYGSAQATTTTRAYDPATLGCTSITDPNNRTTTMTYDARGNRLTSKDALGRETRYTYDALNNVTSVRDPKGITTTMAYDAQGNLLTRSRPLLNEAGTATVATRTVTLNYRENNHPYPGDVTSMVDPIGHRWSFAYDGYGNLTSATDPHGRPSTAAYDALGRRTSSVSPRGNGLLGNPGAYTTSYAYDPDGRLTRVTDPLGHVTARHYDANRNLASVTDANGKKTTYLYDAADQLTDVRRHDNTTLRNEYFPDGRLKAQRDGAGAPTAYAYDSLGRLASVTDPANRTTTYGHDPAGNVAAKQDPGGNCAAVPKVACTTFGYDAADQLKTISYSDGATPNVTIGYDANGRRTSMTDGTGSSSWRWDSLNRLVASSTGSSLAGGPQTVSYGYDLRGSVTSLTYPGGLTVTRSYHASGTLSSQNEWTGNGMTFSYDADDNLTGRNVPGIDTSFAYDAAGDLTSIYANTLILLGVGALGYTRDAAGMVTASSGAGPMAESNSYTYTDLNQVGAVNGDPYGYDAADNLTRLADGTVQAFGPANQLCWAGPSASSCAAPSAGATTFAHDTRGNRTSRAPAGSPATTYGYDQANRLTSASPGPGATYRYRGDGLRLAKTVGGVTTTFNWEESGPLPLLVSETANGATTRYVYDDKGLPLEQIRPDGTRVYMHHDQLGSVRMLTENGASSPTGTSTYDAYGRKTASTGAVTTPFGFAGEYTDAETGFVYLRARYYDPATGQFITRDPIEMLTREPYGYTGGNPLNRTDPGGLNWISDRVTQAAGYVYDHRKGIAQGLAVAGIVVAGIAIAPIAAAAVSAGLSSLAGSVGMSGTAAIFAAEIGGFAATANTLALTSFVLSAGSTFLTCQDGWTTACKISLASTAGGGFLSGIGALTRPLNALLASIGSFSASLAGTHSPNESSAAFGAYCAI